jgi:DNA-binding MarR family transcriptional regulator
MLAEAMPGGFDQDMSRVLRQCGVDDPRGYELFFALQAPVRLLGVVASRHLQIGNLSLPRVGLLTWLYFGEQLGHTQGISPSRLSEFQHVSRNTVSALLRSLEEQGLVERTLCKEDRRRFHIRLSETGRALVCAVLAEQGPFLAELFSDLSAEEQATLIGLLEKLRRSLHERVSEQ